jgi:hypothetical protein
MARKKNQNGVNKSAIVREALQSLGLDASSKEVADYIRAKHGEEVVDGMSKILQNYVSQQKKKLRGGGAAPSAGRRGRRPKAQVRPDAQPAKAKAPLTGGSFADDMVALAGLVEKYGGGEVRRLTELLGKR